MTKKSTPPQKNYYKNKYEEVSFLDPKRLKEQEDKISNLESKLAELTALLEGAK